MFHYKNTLDKLYIFIIYDGTIMINIVPVSSQNEVDHLAGLLINVANIMP